MMLAMPEQPTPSTEPLTDEAFHGASDPVDGVDIALGVIGLPLLAFALMFATSGMSIALARRGKRRRLLATFVVVELVIVAVIVLTLVQ